jgi:hypothetical protein
MPDYLSIGESASAVVTRHASSALDLTLYSAVVGVALFFVFLYLFYHTYKQRRKENE